MDENYTQVPMREPHGQVQQRVSSASDRHVEEMLPFLPQIARVFVIQLLRVGDIYQVIDGNTVIDAARRAGWSRLPAMVIPVEDTPIDQGEPVWIVLDEAGDRVEPRDVP